MKDYRYQKTEKHIIEACIHLAQKKDIYSLTVTEIAKEADINRITFYSHYENIDALVKHIENLYTESGFEEMAPFADLINAPEEFLKRSMKIYHQKRAQIFFDSSRSEQFMKKSIDGIIQRTLEECPSVDEELRKKIVFIVNGIYGIYNEYDIEESMILRLSDYVRALLS